MPHDDSVPVPEPWQFAVHGPSVQSSGPHASRPPEQVVVHGPVPLHAVLPHAPAPVHVRLQLPVEAQVIVPQTAEPLPPLHVCVQLPVPHMRLSHAPDPVQVAVTLPVVLEMLAQAFVPVHVTSQFFVRHWIVRHASSATQSMSQLAALPQLMAPHALGVGQPMVQFHAVGHTMLPLPVPVIVHVLVAKSQPPLQVAGHTAASSSRASAGSWPTTQ